MATLTIEIDTEFGRVCASATRSNNEDTLLDCLDTLANVNDPAVQMWVKAAISDPAITEAYRKFHMGRWL